MNRLGAGRVILPLVLILLSDSSAAGQTYRYRIPYQVSTNTLLPVVHTTTDADFPRPTSYYQALASEEFQIPMLDVKILEFTDAEDLREAIAASFRTQQIPKLPKELPVFSGVAPLPVVPVSAEEQAYTDTVNKLKQLGFTDENVQQLFKPR